MLRPIEGRIRVDGLPIQVSQRRLMLKTVVGHCRLWLKKQTFERGRRLLHSHLTQIKQAPISEDHYGHPPIIGTTYNKWGIPGTNEPVSASENKERVVQNWDYVSTWGLMFKTSCDTAAASWPPKLANAGASSLKLCSTQTVAPKVKLKNLRSQLHDQVYGAILQQAIQ